MTFKLDPGALLAARQEANQRAKAWQGGSTSSMSFADGMDLGLPSFGDYSGIPSGGSKIITPETGVRTNNATDILLGDQIDAYGDQAELAMQALGLQGEVARAKKQYEFAKELARERSRKKRGGGLGGSIGGLIGTVGGTMIGGPIGGAIGGQIGGGIGSLFG